MNFRESAVPERARRFRFSGVRGDVGSFFPISWGSGSVRSAGSMGRRGAPNNRLRRPLRLALRAIHLSTLWGGKASTYPHPRKRRLDSPHCPGPGELAGPGQGGAEAGPAGPSLNPLHRVADGPAGHLDFSHFQTSPLDRLQCPV